MAKADICRKKNFNVCKYINKKYRDYKYGDPAEAASLLVEDYEKIEKVIGIMDKIFKNMSKHLDVAGNFVRPGMRVQVKQDVKRIVNVQRMLNTL